MTEHQREYIREYYQARRARLYAAAPDPETHPVRVWRKKHNLSMTQAGLLFGVTDSAVWGWEKSLVPTPEWVEDIIQDDMTDYMKRKLHSLEDARRARALANPVRVWRTARKLTQPALAEILGVTQRTVSSWENEERPTPAWVLARLEEL